MDHLSPELEPKKNTTTIIQERLDFLRRTYGSAYRAGESELWLPFHAPDAERHVDRLTDLCDLLEDFHTLPKIYGDAQEQDFQANDIGVLAITLSHFYPDMRDLRTSNSAFTAEALDTVQAASARNIALVETVRDALHVKLDSNGRHYQPINIDSPFILHQLLSGDALMSCMTDETSPTDMLLLVLEHLLKEEKITYTGRSPRNMREVYAAEFDEQAFARHLTTIYDRWYGAPRNFHLPTTTLHFDKYEMVQPVAAEMVAAADSSSFATLLEIAKEATHQQIGAPPSTIYE